MCKGRALLEMNTARRGICMRLVSVALGHAALPTPHYTYIPSGFKSLELLTPCHVSSLPGIFLHP